MTIDFAVKWAFGWLAAFAIMTVIMIAAHLPPAHSTMGALVTGGFVGAWIIGPILIAAARRS